MCFYFTIDCENAPTGTYDVFFDHEALTGDRFPWKGVVEVTEASSRPEFLTCEVQVSKVKGQTGVEKMGTFTIIQRGETVSFLRQNLPAATFLQEQSPSISGIGVYVSFESDRARISGLKTFQ